MTPEETPQKSTGTDIDAAIEQFSKLQSQKPDMIARLLEERSAIDRKLALLGHKRTRKVKESVAETPKPRKTRDKAAA